MGTPDNKLSELVDIFKSWMPRRTEPTNVSRDFWMPDHSCRVCYDCDSQFTIFNRRHHCRLCGRVFCARCTANSVPAPSDELRIGREDGERIRVCNFCFKQWEQGIAAVDNGAPAPSPGLSPSPSATSLVSTKSSCTYHSSSSTVGSTPYSTGPYQRVPYSSGLSPRQSCQGDSVTVQQDNVTSQRSIGSDAAMAESSPNQFGFCMDSRSDDEDDDYGVYHSDSDSRHFSHANDYYGAINNEEFDSVYEPQKVHSDGENTDAKSLSSLSPENFDTQGVVGKKLGEESDDHDNGDECEASPYDMETANAEPVDFENNGLLWLPPEPEDEEDEREADLFDDDDDGGGDGGGGATGEWGYLHSSNNFGGGEFRTREKSVEEHRKAMKNVVEGHFRALVSQLLQVENLPLIDEDDKETWLDIITSLSWEAATLLKPDTSKGGGMDPGGYVKVKCIACGSRSESMVVKGVVCKKNVAHRRMTSKIEKPRFLILGGALEYQRVSNLLSSFDTLLQQEMDHLKMAVAKIDAHHPNVLLVEKSVSRYAQDYLLAKDISLVLNIKRPLLERLSRCTGAQIVPSIDHLTSPKLGYCDMFHVEKFFEVHGSAGQGGKKLTKTLMFFEGCPKPLGVTILLKGTNGDELKKVKHVVQYGVFAAYHLALETSFLADEGASLPELPLKSVITVLPDKPSSIDRSISTIPGFSVPAAGKPQGSVASSELQKSNKGFISDSGSCTKVASILKNEGTHLLCLSKALCSPPSLIKDALSPIESTSPFTSLSPPGQDTIDSYHKELFSICASEDNKDNKNVSSKESCAAKTAKAGEALVHDSLISNSFSTAEAFVHGGGISHADGVALASNLRETPQHLSIKYHTDNQNEEVGSSKEEFPPSPSDHQSILVSLSTRCVWKGTVCERAHLFRIKYYGSFDKPLGRFLRDHLFDHGYLCRSCGMPSEAHIHCYTHRQGSLTISVKKLPEIFLPGEKEGKIWMWHRCLRCPRTSGFPPATRRVVMSDAAWGLSFGKFLELSFSNHAAANRVASCGHSLHRDCLRFYGFGRMVACFRYASIHIHSVYLPPPKLEFYYDNQEWIQKEAYEVGNRAELLFTELRNALHQILEKTQDGGKKAPESTHQIAELKEMLQKEREDFEESLKKVINGEVKSGQPAIDILEINKLRRQLLFHSYVWDQRLIHAASLSNKNFQEGVTSSIAKLKEKPIVMEKLVEIPGKGLSSYTALQETKPGINLKQGGDAGYVSQTGEVQNRTEMGLDTDHGNEASANVIDKSDSLESGKIIGMALSEGNECSAVESLSDTLDAAWTGKTHPTSTTPKENGYSLPDSTLVKSSPVVKTVASISDVENGTVDQGGVQATQSVSSAFPLKGLDNAESYTIGARMPFLSVTSSFSKSISFNTQKLCIGEHNPVYVALFRELERQTGARLLLPIGVNDTVIPVFDDEPTSVIAYTLVSPNYHLQISERPKDALDSAVSLPLFDSTNLLSLNSFDETVSETYRSLGSSDESILSMSHSRSSDSLLSKDIHARVSFTDEGPLGKVKYTVTSYYATQFEALRKTCCPSELDFVRSLSRCKKWGAQGGKSNVFFAKTLDDRFIIKQVTKTELESFIKFAPAYFKYLSESISTRSPTCLAKILGIYQVSSKHGKAGKETKMDVLVMENLLFRRNVTRLYDLKGSSRSRYNPDTSGSNKVLLDQNLIEAMPTSPIFVGNKAKRLLERAVWNDTAFLASIDVMDYSLLVGVDEEKHELVLGIIDFMRQYTWDKHLETWVKASGILGGPKNTSPTVISPQQYKKRFRKAMTTYFLMVPDQWSPQTIVPESQSDHFEETSQAQSDL